MAEKEQARMNEWNAKKHNLPGKRNYFSVLEQYNLMNQDNLRLVVLDKDKIHLRDIIDNCWLTSKSWPAELTEKGEKPTTRVYRYEPLEGIPNPLPYDLNCDLLQGECLPYQLFGRNSSSASGFYWNLHTIEIKAAAMEIKKTKGGKTAQYFQKQWAKRVKLCKLCGWPILKLHVEAHWNVHLKSKEQVLAIKYADDRYLDWGEFPKSIPYCENFATIYQVLHWMPTWPVKTLKDRATLRGKGYSPNYKETNAVCVDSKFKKMTKEEWEEFAKNGLGDSDEQELFGASKIYTMQNYKVTKKPHF